MTNSYLSGIKGNGSKKSIGKKCSVFPSSGNGMALSSLFHRTVTLNLKLLSKNPFICLRRIPFEKPYKPVFGNIML